MNDNLQLGDTVMDAIRSGKIRMRPRWRFWVSSALLAASILLLLGAALYVASFALFMLRESGVLFVPMFGIRGTFAFLRALPLIVIALLVALLVLFEALARRYALVYRRPILIPFLAIVIIVVVGGVALERTRIHRALFLEARAHRLPQPIAALYGAGGAPVPGVYRGAIVTLTPEGFLMRSDSDDATSSVVLTAATRRPADSSFSTGQEVVVFGDESSGTIRAIGVRAIDK